MKASELLSRNSYLSEKVEKLIDQMGNFDSSSIATGSNSSEKIRAYVSSQGEWKRNVLVCRGFPTAQLPSSHVEVEFLCERVEENGTRSRIYLEILGDNRQAMGTNLLKLELANLESGDSGESLAVGVAIENDLKKIGWDGSAATFEEYEYAIMETYSRFISTPLVLIGVGL